MMLVTKFPQDQIIRSAISRSTSATCSVLEVPPIALGQTQWLPRKHSKAINKSSMAAAKLSVRIFRDTGRTDSDLQRIPVLNEFGSRQLGERVRQPNTNLAPQIGITWDPAKNGKTVIRAGGGLFYENALFSNVLGDRAGRLTQGLFL